VPWAPGTLLGPYEITGTLGAGGMGEVYRARDTKLKRDVAIKVVPEAFAHDPERLARFRREAELLASLNHPNIASIHGFEESGPGSTGAIVMELVEGGTLADRLKNHPGGMSVNEALPIARQVADALQAAHERGVIHRDLKPGNIAFAADGRVKVLDFGLAKAVELAQGPGQAKAQGDFTQSPTITTPAATQAGLILGTAAYMSPEQAKGRPADKRSDVWAFGCVLYEMLARRRAFEGEDMTDTLAAVLRGEPDWTKLPDAVPASVRTLIKRCLDKDRQRRVADIAAAIFVLDEPALSNTATTAGVGRPVRSRERLAWTAATLALSVLTGVTVFLLTRPQVEPPPVIRFSVSPPDGTTFQPVPGSALALSPDGRRIAFAVVRGGRSGGLAVRSFDAAEPQILADTEGSAPLAPFWSPDSRFVAFFSQGKLKKIDLNSGTVQVLCDAPSSAGGTWGPDGTIVFAPEISGGLYRVSSAGGTPTPVTTLDPARQERSHRFPWFLPDGRRFLFVAQGPPKVHIGSTEGPERTELASADSRAMYGDGHVLFVRDGTLLAQPFDAARATPTGEPFPVAEDVSYNPVPATASVSVSANGVLAYRTGIRTELSELVWFDRRGNRLSSVGERIDQTNVQLSPDGTRVAVSEWDPARDARDIAIYDLTQNGARRKVTLDPADDFNVLWSPDGASVIFNSSRQGQLDVYRRSASGGREELLLDDARNNVYPTSLSSDGRFLVYHTGIAASATGNDLWVLPLYGDRTPIAVAQTSVGEAAGQFSPDGRWIAYQANEFGQSSVVVVPFAAPGQGSGTSTPPAARADRVRVSTAAGSTPRWRRDGKEIFYSTSTGLMAAEVNGDGAVFQVGAVQPLFDVRRRTAGVRGWGPQFSWDVSADGQRFLVNTATETLVPPPATVILNWTASLRR
jgi:serine/threonine protein kinase/Tol biopolymer transport system component